MTLADSRSHAFDNDAFRALSVDLGIINLLPGPEIEPPIGHWHNHLMMHHQALEMRVAIRLAGAMMPVVVAIGGDFLEPFVDVGQQSVLCVIDPNTGGDV